MFIECQYHDGRAVAMTENATRPLIRRTLVLLHRAPYGLMTVQVSEAMCNDDW